MSAGKSSNRTVFATCDLLFPTRSATASCVNPKSAMSCLYAIASSTAFKSCRWMFSISAHSSFFLLSASRTITGTVAKPIALLARKRRSPAISSYVPSPISVTTSGCKMPCSLMLAIKSSRSSCTNVRRGWYGFATIFDGAISTTRKLASAISEV